METDLEVGITHVANSRVLYVSQVLDSLIIKPVTVSCGSFFFSSRGLIHMLRSSFLSQTC